MFDFSLDNKLKKLWQIWKPIRDKKREQNCQNEDRISNFVKFHQFETKIDSLTQRYNNIMERHELNSMKNNDGNKSDEMEGKVSNIKKEITERNVEKSYQNEAFLRGNVEMYPYLQIEPKEILRNPEKIAKNLIEDYNIPGKTKPMPVDSSGLPKGMIQGILYLLGLF